MLIPRRLVALAALVSVAGCGFNRSNNSPRAMEPPPNPRDIQVAPEPEINFDTRLAAGKLAESRGDWEGAVQQYERANRMRPKDIGALHALGVAYTVLKRYDDGIRTWQRVIDLSGGSSGAWNNLAQCYEYAGRTKEAEHAYRTAIAMDPQSAIARTNYGLMLVRGGQIDEGRQQMLQVLPPAEVHYNIASVLESQGKITLAKSEYIQALKVDPRMDDARKRLARIE